MARILYKTAIANGSSTFNRSGGKIISMEMTEEEFCLWRKKVELKCHFCGIKEKDIPLTGMKSQIQHPIKTLGVDRLDSNLGYREDNIAPCCFVCNQIKGNRFSESEMLEIGKSIKTVWTERIKKLS